MCWILNSTSVLPKFNFGQVHFGGDCLCKTFGHPQAFICFSTCPGHSLPSWPFKTVRGLHPLDSNVVVVQPGYTTHVRDAQHFPAGWIGIIHSPYTCKSLEDMLLLMSSSIHGRKLSKVQCVKHIKSYLYCIHKGGWTSNSRLCICYVHVYMLMTNFHLDRCVFFSNLGKLILKAFFFEMWTCPQQPANGRQWGSTFMARCFEMTEGCDECVREDGRQQMMGWSGVESELLNIRMWKISNRIVACSQYVQLLKQVANDARQFILCIVDFCKKRQAGVQSSSYSVFVDCYP